MSKAKIILASTLSVLAVGGVTTAAVVVTQKRKKQSDSPKKGNEGNQVVVAADSKFEYTLNTEQTKELSAKLLLVKGQDVTVTLTENNASKIITTKVKEDGTIDFSTLKDGKTYTVTKIVVKGDEKDRDLISEVKSHNEDPGQGKGADAGGSDAGKQDKPADQAGDGKQERPADQAGDGKQERPADQAGDGKQDKPADQAGDGKQEKPADQAGDGKQEKPADQAGDGKQERPADQAGDGKQERPADQAGDGKQDKPADQAGDGKQERPADQAGDGKQDKPADQAGDGKHLTYSKWKIKKIEFNKNGQVVLFEFETENKYFNNIQNNEFFFKMESESMPQTIFEFEKYSQGNKDVWAAGISRNQTHTTFEMSSKRQFYKGDAREGTYKLLGVYPKDNPEQNLLQDTTKTVVVKYE
ncbi:DUF1410 domain-containing protein [Mycoplasmopsis bovigenitalium]|uniref:DUF1410 domain-containing protein n=1 Tax=Mycoplasmopsis bovigenitalium TaxID=2112 RepID=UPI000BBA640E|nr:DUF1410 domain-containing protein [Mycoplasmopsis bovigenitalium]